MGLVDQALELERRAEANYRSAAQTTQDSGARSILILLADEEARHAAVLRGFADIDDSDGPDLLKAARSWVRGAIEGKAQAISADGALLDVLRRAMSIERTTEAFYREHAANVADERAAALFRKLATIERTHYEFVSSLVEYFDRPNEWVEDAEFGVRGEY